MVGLIFAKFYAQILLNAKGVKFYKKVAKIIKIAQICILRITKNTSSI